ncbi:transcription factor BHLH062 isoform X2 [Magnolia sinica]|nr:transcription factor BHLH062 isoform X2 [Magnolia sinica]
MANKKNPGKPPKKIHKAEREKLKRDHLNELFLELGHALEPARQNSGKASILGDTTRLLRELLVQVDCLKKENAALLTESHYVNVEKNELRDENAVLGTEIEKLQNQLRERMQSVHAWSNPTDAAPIQLQHCNSTLPSTLENQLPLPVVDPVLQPPPVMGPPVFVIPLSHEVQAYPEAEIVQVSHKPPSHVRRPHARYPTPSDSWPSQLLVKQPGTAQETQLSLGSCPTVNGEDGSGNVEAS